MSNPIYNVTFVYDDNHDAFEHVEHHSAHDSTVSELYALVGPDNVKTAEKSTNPQHIYNIWCKGERSLARLRLLQCLLKTTHMEDDPNGRQLKWKTTKMEDEQNGR